MGVPRWRWTLGVVSGLLALGAPCASGADAPISPDRPSVTNNTETVRPGVAQLETGVEYAKSSIGGGESDRRFAAQLALRTGLTGAFVEVAFASRDDRDARDAVALRAGIVYLLGRDVALDAAAGASLAGQGPDYTVIAGVSVRLGHR